MMIELKDMLFKMLYGWIIAISSSRFADFVEFMDIFLFPLPKRVFFSCILLVYLGCADCFTYKNKEIIIFVLIIIIIFFFFSLGFSVCLLFLTS
jgi:hypothetical protein